MAQMSPYEVPTQIRDVAETSLEQARRAFDGFIGAARRASDTVRDSADLVRTHAQAPHARNLDCAVQNVRAALDHVRKLAATRSIPEAIELQTAYARERFATLQARAGDLGGPAQGAFRQGADATRATVEQRQAAAHAAAGAARQVTGEASR